MSCILLSLDNKLRNTAWDVHSAVPGCMPVSYRTSVTDVNVGGAAAVELVVEHRLAALVGCGAGGHTKNTRLLGSCPSAVACGHQCTFWLVISDMSDGWVMLLAAVRRSTSGFHIHTLRNDSITAPCTWPLKAASTPYWKNSGSYTCRKHSFSCTTKSIAHQHLTASCGFSVAALQRAPTAGCQMSSGLSVVVSCRLCRLGTHEMRRSSAAAPTL